MAKFTICASWSVSADIVVEADSLEEAIKKADNVELDDYNNVSYIDGSFEINEEVVRELNPTKG